MEGPEVSAFALCDGRDGACRWRCPRTSSGSATATRARTPAGWAPTRPLPFVDGATEAAIWDADAPGRADAMAAEGVDLPGRALRGLMLTADGPKVLEFNCRFGDPETEVVIPRLGSDLAELLLAAATGSLADVKVSWLPETAVTVVLASGGYPGPYETGVADRGPRARPPPMAGAVVFHAGTAERDGRVVTRGRPGAVRHRLGATIAEARDARYEACARDLLRGHDVPTDIAAQAAREDLSG